MEAGVAAAPYEYLLKFIIVGDTSVGKSCLLLKFVDRRFQANQEATIGVDFGVRTVRLERAGAKLQIWDTAGQESFRSITRAYYRGAAAALVVYDTTRRASFEHVQHWLTEVRAAASGGVAPVVTLVGNKADLREAREVEAHEGQELAASVGAAFFETSAKDDLTSVDAVFTRTADAVLLRVFQDEAAELPGVQRLKLTPLPPQSACCQRA
jgi:Ras-related protein Rab-2A